MSNSYENLQAKFVNHLSRYQDQRRKAVSILSQAVTLCIREHGIPEDKITFYPPSETMPDGNDMPLEFVIDRKPTGAWGLNIVIQVDNPAGPGTGHMVTIVHPEISFDDSDIQLALQDSDLKFSYGDVEEVHDRAVRDFAAVMVNYVDETIILLEKSENERGRRMGFHPGS